MKFIENFRSVLSVLLLAAILAVSCKGKQTDADIQTAVNEKIRSNDEMKGLTASVNNGVVTLSGECPTEECKKDCADKIGDIKGVKSVENNIQIGSVASPAPVEVATDDVLKTSVDNVVKNYEGVKAEVNDGVVTLRGEIKRDNLQNLMIALNELKPKKIDNQLAVK